MDVIEPQPTTAQDRPTVASLRERVSYPHWGAVPWTLASKSQLAKADFPREVGGPVRGWVSATGWNDKDTEIELFAVADSVPTRASAGQLAAARRRSSVVRVCGDCGANCQQPLTPSGHDGVHRCLMCRRIARQRAFQAELRDGRPALAQWAHRLLADPSLAVVWVDLLEAPLTPAGNRRPPLAARVHAVDRTGHRLVDVTIRLAGPRTSGAPADAVSAEDGAAALKQALDGRVLVGWQHDVLVPVADRLAVLGHRVAFTTAPAERQRWNRRPVVEAAGERVARWRAELDPATGRLRTPWAPGTADRLWLQLTNIAATATPERGSS